MASLCIAQGDYEGYQRDSLLRFQICRVAPCRISGAGTLAAVWRNVGAAGHLAEAASSSLLPLSFVSSFL